MTAGCFISLGPCLYISTVVAGRLGLLQGSALGEPRSFRH